MEGKESAPTDASAKKDKRKTKVAEESPAKERRRRQSGESQKKSLFFFDEDKLFLIRGIEMKRKYYSEVSYNEGLVENGEESRLTQGMYFNIKPYKGKAHEAIFLGATASEKSVSVFCFQIEFFTEDDEEPERLVNEIDLKRCYVIERDQRKENEDEKALIIFEKYLTRLHRPEEAPKEQQAKRKRVNRPKGGTIDQLSIRLDGAETLLNMHDSRLAMQSPLPKQAAQGLTASERRIRDLEIENAAQRERIQGCLMMITELRAQNERLWGLLAKQ
jgi:hypothetical protein